MNLLDFPEARSNMDFRSIPFKYVPMNVRKNLAQLLDIRCKVFASDWTSLGAEVGLTFHEKMVSRKLDSFLLAGFVEILQLLLCVGFIYYVIAGMILFKLFIFLQ